MAAEPSHGVEGRTVVVTGGGAGIGRGIATHLVRSGASVVVAERDKDRMADAVGVLEKEGPCIGVLCDVGVRADLEAAVAAAVDAYGRVDGIVNNAMAWPPFGALAELTEDELDICVRTGIKGTLWAMQAVHPHMKAAGYGRIINVGSSAGLIGFPGYGAYALAKEAIRSLTRTAAREWAADGITVNCYLPVSVGHKGMAPTAETAFTGPFQQIAMGILSALSPTHQDGDAEADIGPVVAFLLSDASRYVTGQSITLDGGSYAFA